MEDIGVKDNKTKLKSYIESSWFSNIILIVIILNSIFMGMQTSPGIVAVMGSLLVILDNICLAIFIIEMILKLIAYGGSYFKDPWNLFDFTIILVSIASSLTFLSTFRVFRVFRVFRSMKAMKSLRSFRLVSGLERLRVIIQAIVQALPSIGWTMGLLLLIYYIFAIMGVTMFGAAFPDWFGSIGKSMYTLFQVMTLESWSMGISRPVMEVYSWAWLYFVPFVLITSFIVMNVVVGIVVNAISTVTEDTARREAETQEISQAQLMEEMRKLQEQTEKMQKLLAQINKHP